MVYNYLQDLSRLAIKKGLPKQRVYTHVWGETDPSDAKAINYAGAAFNLYSRPGMSFYGFAQKPLLHPLWRQALANSGPDFWGAVEYSTDKDYQSWMTGLSSVFNSEVPAKVLVVYNWREHRQTPAVTAMADFLRQAPVTTGCRLADIYPQADYISYNPADLNWQFSSVEESALPEKIFLHLVRGIKANRDDDKVKIIELQPQTVKVAIPRDIPPGVYSWYLEAIGCQEKKKLFSEPRVVTISAVVIEPEPPFWVNWLLAIFP